MQLTIQKVTLEWLEKRDDKLKAAPCPPHFQDPNWRSICGTSQKKSDPLKAPSWIQLGSDPSSPSHRTSVGVLYCLSQGRWCWVLWFLRVARLGLHGLYSFSCMPWMFNQIGICGIWRPCWPHELFIMFFGSFQSRFCDVSGLIGLLGGHWPWWYARTQGFPVELCIVTKWSILFSSPDSVF